MVAVGVLYGVLNALGVFETLKLISKLTLRTLREHDAAVLLGCRSDRQTSEHRRACSQRAGRNEFSSSLHDVPQNQIVGRLYQVPGEENGS